MPILGGRGAMQIIRVGKNRTQTKLNLTGLRLSSARKIMAVIIEETITSDTFHIASDDHLLGTPIVPIIYGGDA